MSTQYNYQTIREMLNAAFNASDIKTLSFDRFPDVYEEFTSGMPKSQIISMLLEWIKRYGQEDLLLSEIEKRNSFQYTKFQPNLFMQISTPSSPVLSSFQQQRLQDLERNIEQDGDLLRQYEAQLRFEDDPRRLMRIQHEIKRQQDALARYRQEYAALDAEVKAEQPATETSEQSEMAALSQKMDALSNQIEDVKSQVKQSEQAIREDVGQQQQAILQRIDQQQQQTVATLVAKLDENQIELVDLLLDALDQHQIGQDQAEQLLKNTQQALIGLHRLRQGQPDAEAWQKVLNLLQQETGWAQKLKLTIPIVPTILEFESELTVDVMPALKQSWQHLVNRIRRK